MCSLVNHGLLLCKELRGHILGHAGTGLANGNCVLLTYDVDDISVHQYGIEGEGSLVLLYVAEIKSYASTVVERAEDVCEGICIVGEASGQLNNLGELGLVVGEHINTGILYAAVDFNGAACGEVRGKADHYVVVGLKLEISLHGIVVSIHFDGNPLQFDFFLFGDVHAENLHAVECCTVGKSAGHGDEVVDVQGGIEGRGEGNLDRTAHAHLAYIGVGGVVVDIERITPLKKGGSAAGKIYLEVF